MQLGSPITTISGGNKAVSNVILYPHITRMATDQITPIITTSME